ncbi:MAG: hypothetical protein CMK09_02185 [Ponticaulis sp.]|nr:hypothetical protein [Ponticaulis sp.]
MKFSSVIILAVALGSISLAAQADDRPYTEKELTACVVLREANELLIQERDRIDDWIDRNRGSSSSNAVIDRFNVQVGRQNALNDMVGVFDDHYNRNCLGSLNYLMYEKVCKTTTSRMNGFIRNGKGCDKWRRNFGE